MSFINTAHWATYIGLRLAYIYARTNHIHYYSPYIYNTYNVVRAPTGGYIQSILRTATLVITISHGTIVA